MADEHTESGEHGGGTNGASVDHADARAAFLAGALDDAPAADEAKAPAAEAPEDDDSDLEEREETAADADDEEDPDKDLDDEDEDDEKAEPDKETARRIEQVQRTDKRIREERERHFAAREAEINDRVESLKREWSPKIEAAERFEKLAARASVDPVAVLRALGVGEDRFEYTAQVLYTLAKAKGGDEKARAAAAQLMKQSEYDAEIADLKKWREERERQDKEREATAAEERKWEAFFSKAEKMVSDKMPLTQQWLKANPQAARVQMAVAAREYIESTGKIPTERDVVVAVEKNRRQALRDLGIDPKSLSAKAATAALAADKTTSAKAERTDKKATAPAKKQAASVVVDDDKPMTREDFVRLNGNYD